MTEDLRVFAEKGVDETADTTPESKLRRKLRVIEMLQKAREREMTRGMLREGGGWDKEFDFVRFVIT